MHPAYFPVLWWSLFIFASFLGYGELLRRVLNRREFDDLGWGLKAAWGMAVVLAIGGLLMALHLAVTVVLSLVVVAGAVAAVVFAADSLRRKPPTWSDFRVSWPGLVLGGLAALAFASSIAWPFQIDPNDDVVCYLFFPQKILQTGTLIEPFNVRRMGTYGGQSLLQALVMIVGGERNAHIPDRGFGMLMIFGMLIHYSKQIPKNLALFRFFTVGCLFFVSVPRINTGSSLTGSALILALILTLARQPLAGEFNLRNLLLPSLLVAGAGTLRPTYLLCVAGIVALEPFLRSLPSPKGWWPALKNAIACVLPSVVGALLFLLPWMAVLWQSNGTPMYPLMAGTMNPEFTLLGNKGGVSFDIAHAFAYLMSPEALVLLFCMGLVGHVRARSLALAATIIAVAVAWFTSYKFGVTILSESYRYTFPMLMPVALWILACALTQTESSNDSTGSKILFPVTLVLGLLLALNLPNAGRELGVQAESLAQQIGSRDPLVNPALTNADRELQNLTPVGSKIFVAVDTPYAFDFARNEIFTADFPGGSSIGKWPLGQGPLALEKYLSAQGFKYIIASDFDNAMLLYTRKHWKEHQRPEWFFKEINGKYFLDFMDNVDAIGQGGRVVATAANLRLIELSPRANP